MLENRFKIKGFFSCFYFNTVKAKREVRKSNQIPPGN